MAAGKICWSLALVVFAGLGFCRTAAFGQEEQASASGRKVAMLIKLPPVDKKPEGLQESPPIKEMLPPVSPLQLGGRAARTGKAISTPAELPDDIKGLLSDCTVVAEQTAKIYFHRAAVLINWIVEISSPNKGLPAITPFASPWLEPIRGSWQPVPESDRTRTSAPRVP